MPRPRPPHLQREITRHGKAVWYVRVGHGPRVRIRAEYGTPEFDAEYRAALAGTPARKAAPSCSSLAWLLARYRETTDLDRPFSRHAATAREYLCGRDRDGRTRAVRADHYRRQSRPGRIDAPRRRTKRAISSTPCAAFSGGRTRRDWSRLIRLLACKTCRASAPKALSRGRRNTSQPTRRAGLSVRASAYGWTFCFTLASDVVTPCALDASMCAVASIKTEKSGFTIEVPAFDPAGAASHPGRRSLRRPDLHRWRQRSAAHKESRSATSSRPRARRLACQDQRTAFASLRHTRMANNGATEAQLMAIFGWTDP